MSVGFPNDSDRIAIVGTTGSGKTVAAAWHLSRRRFDVMPWLIIDFKRDELLNSIPGLREIGLSDPVPDKPGLYIVHPHPMQADELDALLWRVWETGNIGVYVDEGFMIGNRSAPFRALLTQGRSLKIPMIILAQRPVWMDKFVFTESQFYQVFRLNTKKDVQSVNEFIPYDVTAPLPEYHSYYYDVKRNRMVVMKPVPDSAAILDTFALRMESIPQQV